MPVFDSLVAEYRYFVTDFLSNEVMAELPFKSVSYERSLNAAGSFSGTIPVVDKTAAYNLYESTMPGKTALYVVRNDQCVWGGVIWSRSYSLESRELSVTANEFSSYLYHRNVWKTFSNSYAATGIVITPGTVALTLTNGTYPFSLGMPVSVSFSTNSTNVYNGVRTVSGPPPTSNTLTVSGVVDSSSNPIPAGTYSNVTVRVRVDTYDYIRSLITNALSDFVNIQFPNTDIEPGVTTTTAVTNKQLTNNVATLTVPGHTADVGQSVVVRGLGSPFNGQYDITAKTSTTVSYNVTASNVPSTAVSSSVFSAANIVASSASSPNSVDFPTASGFAAFVLGVNHGLSVGDYVTVAGFDDPAGDRPIFNGTSKVTSIESSTSFTMNAQSFKPSDGIIYRSVPYVEPPAGSTITATPSISYGTYGSFSSNSDFDLEFSTNGYSGEEHLADNDIRGFELKSIGEILDEYADALNGFEYRIDCYYDTATAAFKREFVFIPLDPIAEYRPLDPGEIPEISWFGADQLVFEYPGNIASVTLDESAENAATRFFVLGSNNNLGNDASQPYAAAANKTLLDEGWPLLDADESKNGVFNEQELYSHAQKYLSEFRPPVADLSVAVNGSLQPTVGSYNPGDWCALIINDDFVKYRLFSDLETRSDILLRKIEGYSVSVPDNPSFPEQVTLKLIDEWEIDKVG